MRGWWRSARSELLAKEQNKHPKHQRRHQDESGSRQDFTLSSDSIPRPLLSYTINVPEHTPHSLLLVQDATDACGPDAFLGGQIAFPPCNGVQSVAFACQRAAALVQSVQA